MCATVWPRWEHMLFVGWQAEECVSSIRVIPRQSLIDEGALGMKRRIFHPNSTIYMKRQAAGCMKPARYIQKMKKKVIREKRLRQTTRELTNMRMRATARAYAHSYSGKWMQMQAITHFKGLHRFSTSSSCSPASCNDRIRREKCGVSWSSIFFSIVMNLTYWALSLFGAVPLSEHRMTAFFLSGLIEIPSSIIAMVLMVSCACSAKSNFHYFHSILIQKLMNRRPIVSLMFVLTAVSMTIAVVAPGERITQNNRNEISETYV